MWVYIYQPRHTHKYIYFHKGHPSHQNYPSKLYFLQDKKQFIEGGFNEKNAPYKVR